MSDSLSAHEIRTTQQQYLVIVTGAYFTTGFFWVFFSLGSVKIGRSQEDISTFFYSMIVLMVSNGAWEILTGWYADKFRRRLSISVGFFASVVGFLLMGAAAFIPAPVNGAGQAEAHFGARLLVWLAGVTVWSLGPALRSGAQEAWLVDRCNFLSGAPPEPLGGTFKAAARRGVMAKAAGAVICFSALFLILIYPSNGVSDASLKLSFSLAGGLAALLTGLLGYYSLRLQEEYWTDPKYQSEESLLAFLWMGIKDLCRVPYLWFTIAFIGATGLNYILSSTIWAYLGHEKTIAVLGVEKRVMTIAVSVIVIELLAGYLSKAFSKQVDRVRRAGWRMPAASLMYLLPVLPLYVTLRLSQDVFIFVLIAATFFFRVAHASVFGTLNTQGQLLIDSDERRAIMLSMSSALASLFMALIFIIINNSRNFGSVEEGVEASWVGIALPCILMLAVGGYLVARGVRN